MKVTEDLTKKSFGTQQQKQAISKLTKQAISKQLPFQLIDLPSKGWGYPENSILSGGKIKLRYPTAAHQSILNSQNLLQKGTVLDQFLKAIIIDYVDLDDLLLGDKNYLLYASRIMTYGPDLDNYQFTCDNTRCGQKFNKKIDLTKLEPKQTPKLFQYPKGTTDFQFKLPKSGSVVYFKLLNGKMSKQIQRKVKKSYDKNSQLLYTLSTRITKYDDVVQPDEIFKKVSKQLSTIDSKELRKYINQLQPNINIRQTIQCPHCNGQMNALITLNIDFFWIKQL